MKWRLSPVGNLYWTWKTWKFVFRQILFTSARLLSSSTWQASRRWPLKIIPIWLLTGVWFKFKKFHPSNLWSNVLPQVSGNQAGGRQTRMEWGRRAEQTYLGWQKVWNLHPRWRRRRTHPRHILVPREEGSKHILVVGDKRGMVMTSLSAERSGEDRSSSVEIGRVCNVHSRWQRTSQIHPHQPLSWYQQVGNKKLPCTIILHLSHFSQESQLWSSPNPTFNNGQPLL